MKEKSDTRGRFYWDDFNTREPSPCVYGYNEIKLFSLKTNEATLTIMIKNGGKIIGDFKNEKYIVLITIK